MLNPANWLSGRVSRRRTGATGRRSLWPLLFLPLLLLLLGGIALFILDMDDDASESKRAANQTEETIPTSNSDATPEPIAAIIDDAGRQVERNSSLPNLPGVDLSRDVSMLDLGRESCGDGGYVVIEDGQPRVVDDLDPEMLEKLGQAGFSSNNR